MATDVEISYQISGTDADPGASEFAVQALYGDPYVGGPLLTSGTIA